MSNFEDVKIFMKTFGQEVKNKAGFPDDKIQQLNSDAYCCHYFPINKHNLEMLYLTSLL